MMLKTKKKGGFAQGLVSMSMCCLTCDDVTEFIGAMIPTDKVGQADDHQTQDGGEDPEPLAGCQPPSQEGHREQAGEDDDGPAQHLEARGAGHVESWKMSKREVVGLGGSSRKTLL